MTGLLILGAGTMAVEALDIAETMGCFEMLGFVVDVPGAAEEVEGFPVYTADQLSLTPNDCQVVGGIVSTKRRGFIERMAKRGYRFTSLIHPSAQISRRSRVGSGCVIHPGVIIASNTVIEEHVMVNRGALIGHDNRIASFTTIGPGANLAGALMVGSGCYLGVGCVIRDHLEIGDRAVVAAGAVVVKPVAANTLVGGVPAQVLKDGVNGL